MNRRSEQKGFGLMEVLLAVLLSALALSALLAVLFQGAARLRAAADRVSAANAAENLVQSMIGNPQNVRGARSFRHYIGQRPAVSCTGIPPDGITSEELAAFHLCRLQQEWVRPLHGAQTAFVVCYDDSGDFPEWQGGTPDFRCGGSATGSVAVKLVWKRGGEVSGHRLYVQE
ncbi:MAG: hypothetical protein Q4A49_00095 [Neisseria sp.]|nr:hypothetical protein [Neisseria sp.]